MMKLTTQEIQITKGDIMMDEIISQIKKQQDINFMNVKDQILIADLALAVDAENNSRYIFHYLHSLDRFFINSADLEIILGQFRHLMWHVGFSSAVALVSNKEWNTYKGLDGLQIK